MALPLAFFPDASGKQQIYRGFMVAKIEPQILSRSVYFRFYTAQDDTMNHPYFSRQVNDPSIFLHFQNRLYLHILRSIAIWLIIYCEHGL